MLFVHSVDKFGPSATVNDTALPSVIRVSSLHAVFAAMRGRGPVSRSELARLTGLSKQTMSDVAKALEEAGWIREAGLTMGGLGRRAAMYQLDERSAFALGIDLGGTKLHLGISDLTGALAGELEEPTDRRGGLHVVRQIRDVMLRVAARAGVEPARIRAGAMGSPGVFDVASGRIQLAPNISALDKFDVAGALQEVLGFPIAVENDVNLAALGERAQDGRRHHESLVFIALGTGIGMGIVANGQLLRGARGGAGEIAYLPLGGDPFDPRGYRLGTLESAVGSAAIVERYLALGGAEVAGVRGVFERLDAGDPAALRTVEEVARLLAQAVMAVAAVLDPGLVVLGGGIGSRPDLAGKVVQLLSGWSGPQPQVEASVLGSRAVLEGALGLGLERLHRDLVRLRPAAAVVPAHSGPPK